MTRPGYLRRVLTTAAMTATVWLLLGSLSAPIGADERPAQASRESKDDVDGRIARLIEQLGDPRYATRQRAQHALRELGLEAFDALSSAQSSNDIEIAMQAKYLVRSLQVSWSRENDPQKVKELLAGYAEQPIDERRNLMEQLAGLEDFQGVVPLCRLVRYESSELLSKRAALLIMRMPLATANELNVQRQNAVLTAMGNSKRVAASWIRVYAQLLSESPQALDRIQDLVANEERLLVQSATSTDRETIRDLLRWYADRLQEANQSDRALAAMQRTISLMHGTDSELIEAVDWFRQRDYWVIVQSIADRFPDTFRGNAMLLYRLAESQARLGREKDSESTAVRALAAVAKDLSKHMEIGNNLQTDGLFVWAEAEYRHVISHMDDDATEGIRAYLSLSEMLHEVLRDKEAGDAANELLAAVKKDDGLKEIIESDLGRDLATIDARMQFFYAEHERKQENYAKQRELLLKGLAADELEVDVLIAMYRLKTADASWKKTTSLHVKKAADDLRKQMSELNARQAQSRNATERTLAKFQLAFVNNQLAWLIANTEGDFDEALRCSLRSLELYADRAGFLDTLGRCYYAKGDYRKAIEYQGKAVKLEPHSPAIRRQFELFQSAWKAALEKQQLP